MKLNFLKLAGLLSFLASAIHVVLVFSDPIWYRTLGAGEQMVIMAQQGSIQPTIITLSIATVLAAWGLYALSGAGVIKRLPLLKPILIIITVIYLVRALAGLILPHLTSHPLITQNSHSFWLVSSLICFIYASVHLVGLRQNWKKL